VKGNKALKTMAVECVLATSRDKIIELLHIAKGLPNGKEK